jgi:hypothetical protein
MKKIKNGAAQTGRTALYKGQSLSSRFHFSAAPAACQAGQKSRSAHLTSANRAFYADFTLTFCKKRV